MSLASLHSICLHKIYGLLKEGVWNFCLTNPFLELPAQDVNKLMEMTVLFRREDPPKIGDIILLLTSGRLIRLDLHLFFPKYEEDIIFKITQTKGSSIFIQDFASYPKEIFIFPLLKKVISGNPYLEELHSHIHPGFDVIRYCRNLRILRVCCHCRRELCFDNLPVDFNVLSSLRNLEILHLPHLDSDTVATILEICPMLISIGQTDSLDSMEAVHQRWLRNNLLSGSAETHFQLRRCVWGKDCRSENPHEREVYDSGFCDKVRFAVIFCPLVTELIFYVHVKEALKELIFLKELTLLRICFHKYDVNFVWELVALLSKIGPQLKHLSITWREVLDDDGDRVPVGIICDRCPHLESLALQNFIFEPTLSSRSSRNYPFKRLTLRKLCIPDRESLLFLLSNCKHLEELFLEDVEGFDDSLLSQIFERNPFTELKVIFVEQCLLTRNGCQLFREKATSIQTILVEMHDENYFYDAKRAVEDPNLRYLEDAYVYVKFKEFFRRRLWEKRF